MKEDPGNYALVQLDRHLQPDSECLPMFYTDDAGGLVEQTSIHEYRRDVDYETKTQYFMGFWDDKCRIPQYTWLPLGTFMVYYFSDIPGGSVNLDQLDSIVSIFLKYKFFNWIDWRKVWKDMDYNRTGQVRHNNYYSGDQASHITIHRYPKIHFEGDNNPLHYNIS